MTGECLIDYFTSPGATEDEFQAFLQGEAMEVFEAFLRHRHMNHSTVNESSIIMTVPSAQNLTNLAGAKNLKTLLDFDVNDGAIKRRLRMSTSQQFQLCWMHWTRSRSQSKLQRLLLRSDLC
jgi:hypothetical protein